VFLWSVGRLGSARATALATAASQLASSLGWVALLFLSVRITPGLVGEHEVSHGLADAIRRAGAALVIPMLLAAVAIEALLGYGLARFLDRVRPDLLPAPPARR